MSSIISPVNTAKSSCPWEKLWKGECQYWQTNKFWQRGDFWPIGQGYRHIGTSWKADTRWDTPCFSFSLPDTCDISRFKNWGLIIKIRFASIILCQPAFGLRCSTSNRNICLHIHQCIAQDPHPPLELSRLAKYKSCQVFCGYAGSLALPGMRRDMKAWCSSSGNYRRHKEEEEEVGMGVWVCSALDGYFMFSFPYEQCSLQLFASISGTHLLFSLPLIFFPSLKEKTCAGCMCAKFIRLVMKLSIILR